MPKKKESVHLNGTSQQFLADFSVVKERLMNHLAHSDKQDAILKQINEKLDVIMGLVNKHELLLNILKAVILLGIGGIITWIATHYA